jgi:hypothetical protein
MTNVDDGWEDIVNCWHSGDPTLAPAQPPSNQALGAMVRRTVRAGLIETVLGVTLGLALGAYIVGEIIAGLPSAYDYVLYGGMLALVASVIVFNVWLRRGAWRSESKGTLAYVSFLHKQASGTINVIKMGKFFGAGVFILMYVLAGLIVVQMIMSDHSLAKPGLATLIMVFVTLFFPALVYVLHKNEKKFVARRQQLETMLESLQ